MSRRIYRISAEPARAREHQKNCREYRAYPAEFCAPEKLDERPKDEAKERSKRERHQYFTAEIQKTNRRYSDYGRKPHSLDRCRRVVSRWPASSANISHHRPLT